MGQDGTGGGRTESGAAVRAPSLADKVRFLGSPGSYDPSPDTVEAQETHMSWVFLAGALVYKLKKPVRYPFLDFSTLAAREHFVREEVRLNRRLAPDVYLGAAALFADDVGRMRLGAPQDGAGEAAGEPPGTVVDWLVVMRRLPRGRMLDRLIAQDAVTPAMIASLADRLAAFFAAAPADSPSPRAVMAHYAREHAVSVAVLRDPACGFDGARLDQALDHYDALFDAARPLIERRATEGRIVEGHGDLRPEHICLCDPVAIIDCLEFNRALRLVDPFEELTFLGLECARLGASWITGDLVARVAEHLGERPPDALIRFYWCYRALLRARLALVHLKEPDPRTPEKWRPLAGHYVDLSLAGPDIS